MRKGRPTRKQQRERDWTSVAKQILHHTSMLAYLLRDPAAASLEQVLGRMRAFRDAWVKTGEGDVLPASGENADLESTLCDVDVFEAVIDLVEQKLKDAKGI